MKQSLKRFILLLLMTILLSTIQSRCCCFVSPSTTMRYSTPLSIHRRSHDKKSNDDDNRRPLARLVVSEDSPQGQHNDLVSALEHAGFDVTSGSTAIELQPAADNNDENDAITMIVAEYRYNIATGMLQLISSSYSGNDNDNNNTFPRWIPVIQPQETVLIKNGWSFLDVDESEKLSPFDVDAANLEGSYQPQWKTKSSSSSFRDADYDSQNATTWSELGFDLTPFTEQQVLEYATTRLKSNLTRRVLLAGATDPPGLKQLHNGPVLAGSVALIAPGIFTCAISNLPLFATSDLSPWTASSGWLSFAQPISPDHIVLVEPSSIMTGSSGSSTSSDRRIEVICARSKCHLGHYFGPGEGYCINASVLNYLRVRRHHHDDDNDKEETSLFSYMSPPVSYRSLEQQRDSNSPSIRILKEILYSAAIVPSTSPTRCCNENDFVCEIVLGAGCFWHVETALRRLPGIIDTMVGYAGGQKQEQLFPSPPTYEQVCQGMTGHAEVVRVKFHPSTLSPRILLDCFLAMHDPTKVRAHGKHARGTGQYRSCILLVEAPSRAEKKEEEDSSVDTAQDALMDCEAQLGRELSTELYIMNNPMDDSFFAAEKRHQRHDEQKQNQVGIVKNNLSTLPADQWLGVYGTWRRRSVLGSARAV